MLNSKSNLVEEKDLVAIAIEGVHCMYIDVITKVNMLTQDKSSVWWLDFGTTIYFCNNHHQFKTYKEMNNWEVLMGDHTLVKVYSHTIVELNFTFGKKLILVNGLHVPKAKKNLVSACILCKKRIQNYTRI